MTVTCADVNIEVLLFVRCLFSHFLESQLAVPRNWTVRQQGRVIVNPKYATHQLLIILFTSKWNQLTSIKKAALLITTYISGANSYLLSSANASQLQSPSLKNQAINSSVLVCAGNAPFLHSLNATYQWNWKPSYCAPLPRFSPSTTSSVFGLSELKDYL